MTGLLSAIVGIEWEPELRGVLIVIIAVVTLCGGIYLVMATNLGARLGFLVALTGLAGWMSLMGVVWMIYGIGLKGPEPSWAAVPGRTVLQDTGALSRAGVFGEPVAVPDDATFAEEATIVADEFEAEGWETLEESDPAFGQAGAAAGEFLEETATFEAGDYRVVAVYDTGGERYPKLGDRIDFVAFFHKPHYVVVDVAPLEPLLEESGRAPATPEIDESRQHQYVYMVRDLGARRQPAFVLTIGGSLIFLTLCWLLHRRERVLVTNRSATPAVIS
ncbi:MAG: hypothetical protein H0U21_09470 [Acidimicrobiia bacterium]|nr:hypothetical protein [Acidimicrobiia bacterium]